MSQCPVFSPNLSRHTPVSLSFHSLYRTRTHALSALPLYNI